VDISGSSENMFMKHTASGFCYLIGVICISGALLTPVYLDFCEFKYNHKN
jgi:hypothetical protein